VHEIIFINNSYMNYTFSLIKSVFLYLYQFPSPMNNPDLHGSPQAVFTSFKLPKPGPGGPLDMAMPMPGSPFGLGNRFPIPMSCFPTSTSPSSVINSVSRVMSAPLGGLPAVASQMAAR